MGSLSNLYISQSYVSLIHLGNDSFITTQSVELQDGLGNGLGIFVNSLGDVNIEGDISASNIPAEITSLPQFNAYTASTNIRLNNVETTTASLNTSVSSLNSWSASAKVAISNLESTSASVNTSISNINTFTSSATVRLNNLESKSASVDVSITNLNTTTASLNTSITNLNLSSASQQISIDNLNSKTGSYATTGSNTFIGNQTIVGAVTASFAKIAGLNYPTADNGAKSFIQTDGAGNLSLQYVNSILEEVRYGENITLGDPLYVSGSNGNRPVVWKAQAADTAKMPVIYIATSTAVANTNTTALTLGDIQGVTTTGYPAGTLIYVGESGGWTATRPSGSASIVQPLGIVTKEGAGGSGRGLVLNPGPVLLPNIQTGYLWVGNGGNQPVAVATSSLVTSVNTGSLLLTASVNVNVLTFTKADGSTFDLTVSASGSAPQGTISSSAQITALGFVSSSVTASSLITASLSGQTLTFTKGDNSTFSILIPDVSGSTINTGSLVTTASFNAYTASNDQRVSSLEVNSASVNISIDNLNQSSASQQVSIDALNINSASVNVSIDNLNLFTSSISTASIVTSIDNLNLFTSSADVRLSNLELSSASQQVSIDNLNLKTGSYATTGSNSFVGIQYITGSLFVSGTTNNDVNIIGRVAVTGPTTGQIPILYVSSSDATTTLGRFSSVVSNTTHGTAFTYTTNFGSYVQLYNLAGTKAIGLSLSGSSYGLDNWVGTALYGQDNLAAYTGFIGFQDGENYTDGRVTILKPLIVSGSADIQSTLTASLQTGYVWVGDSTGRTTTVATSSFGGGGAAFPYTGSAQITGSLGITGSLNGLVNTLSIASNTASLDFTKGNFFTLQLVSGSITHLTATNIIAGQTVNLLVKTDSGSAAASGSLTFSSTFKFAGGIDYTPTAITASQDLVSFITFDTTQVLAAQVKNLS